MSSSDATRRRFLHDAGLGAAALALGCRPTGDKDPDTRESGVETDETDETETDTGPADTGLDPDVDYPDTCRETPPAGEGPFYREDAPFRRDLNPTGESGPALRIRGYVLDEGCVPIEGALIDVWHCQQDGVYDMTRDEMLFRGRMYSQVGGWYWFTTLMPVSYETGDGSGDRIAKHIHLKISAPGYQPKMTQIRFENDPENELPDGLDTVIPVTEGDDGVLEGELSFVLLPQSTPPTP